MRTTLDIDDPILREVKAIHEKEGRSVGAIVSELLADLTDKESVYATLDADRP